MHKGEEYSSFEWYARGKTPNQHASDQWRNVIEVITSKLHGNQKLLSLLDIGCGAGLLLDIASALEMETFGVESDSSLYKIAESKGHRLANKDATRFSNSDFERRFDIIVISHLIEHINPSDAFTLIKACYDSLDGKGILCIITPNAYDIRVMLGRFYKDPTHIRPYPLSLLRFFIEANDMQVVLADQYDTIVKDRMFFDNLLEIKKTEKRRFFNFRQPNLDFLYPGLNSIILGQKCND